MKLLDPSLNVEINGESRVASFGMKPCRKSFHMVTSGIYSNKIRAIVRELSTNAWDSQKSAGQDEPFTIHLPNTFEPYLSVLDNGIGMSEEFVFDKYTKYFESDKTDTDDLTGCWGLGSKTPFCYGDSFTVRSRYNGKAKIYSAYFDKDGLPTIAKMSEEETSEMDGVEVSFPVKATDFVRFYDEAADVLSWFEPRPIVKGCADFKFKEQEYIKRNENYGITKSHRGMSNLIMGNVSYPIGKHDVGLDEVEYKIVDYGVDLFVPLGSGVEVTVGREHLSYTDNTIRVVKERLKEVVESIKKEVEEEFQKAPTLWQARRMFHDFRHSILGQVKTLVSITWQGHNIIEAINLKELTIPQKPKLEFISKRKQNYMRNEHSIIVADGKLIFNNDLKWGGYARITNWLAERDLKSAYVLTDLNKEFLDVTGVGETLINTSSLPKPEKEKSTKVGVKKKKSVLLKYNNAKHYSQLRQCWDTAEVEMQDGGVYVIINRFQPLKTDGTKYCPVDLGHIDNDLNGLEKPVEIFGIRQADVSKLQKHGNWIELTDYVKKVLDELKYLSIRRNKASQLEHVSRSYEMYLGHDVGTGLFAEFVEEWREADLLRKSDKVNAFNSLSRRFGLYPDKDGRELENLEDKVLETYPLLRFLDWWAYQRSGFIESVVGYIQSTDGFIRSKEVVAI